MVLKEYNKVKSIFKKPKMKVFFGFWSTPLIGRLMSKYYMNHWFNDGKEHKVFDFFMNPFLRTDPTLPVWRRGITINLFKSKRKYVNGNFEWTDEFQEKLNKWHLGWLKPIYTLPTIFSFYVFKFDVIWKTKYDDCRYELPPQLTIVLFNISLSFHWHAPYGDVFQDDDYWESILEYNYNTDSKLSVTERLIQVSDKLGRWEDNNGKKNYVLDHNFLKYPYDKEIIEHRK